MFEFLTLLAVIGTITFFIEVVMPKIDRKIQAMIEAGIQARQEAK